MAGEILRLVNEDPIAAGKLTRGVMEAVAKSFTAERKKAPTQDEIRRRGKICLDVARMLKGDLRWTVDRIVSALPEALRAKLDGLPWEPPKERSVYVASPEDPLERALRNLEADRRKAGFHV